MKTMVEITPVAIDGVRRDFGDNLRLYVHNSTNKINKQVDLQIGEDGPRLTVRVEELKKAIESAMDNNIPPI